MTVINKKNECPPFLIAPGLRIVLLFLSWVLGSILMLFVSLLLNNGSNQDAMMRISVVVQDVLMWVVPAIVTAMIVTRRPARLLAIDCLPSMRQTLLAIFLLIVSTPLMSWIINFNSSIHLPESLSMLETNLRAMEDASQKAVESLLATTSPLGIVVNILIIGLLAGFSEELFFRGALQRILASSNMSVHAAIWISAIVFSALHFQFFGFIPRMLLGATFGYLLLWSGSVWLPMLIHALNNTAYVVFFTTTGSGEPSLDGAASSWVGIAVSCALTIATLVALAKSSKSDRQNLPV